MRRIACLYLVIMYTLALSGQAFWKETMEPGKVERGEGLATVSVNHPEALYEAIRTVREEFGWVVSYEAAPLFSSYDLVDNTDPTWLRQNPQGKRVSIPAGGYFRSSFPERSDMSSAESQEATLKKIVADYNASSNPGKYKVVKISDDTFDVVGGYVRDKRGARMSVKPILDLPVTLAEEERSVGETVTAILNALSISTGKQIKQIYLPTKTFEESSVSLGGRDVPARIMLYQVLHATNRPLLWELRYDPNTDSYLFSCYLASKNRLNRAGERVPEPLDLYNRHR